MTNADGLTINGRFLTQRMTGVQRYAREITIELDQLLKSSLFREGAQATSFQRGGRPLNDLARRDAVD